MGTSRQPFVRRRLVYVNDFYCDGGSATSLTGHFGIDQTSCSMELSLE